MVQYLRGKDHEFWNRANIILLAIFVEHLVIGLKIILAVIIPDLPDIVVKDEARRDMLVSHA